MLLVTVWTEGFASITCQVSRTQRNLALIPLAVSPLRTLHTVTHAEE